ncbi:Fis family transcriptional regulator [candidate division LCP-89 bacterium B3_LCP]|uniref:Fis family transcriptional regulator n=1 Tax=candidate division LCP-89 bacterium B3_LCP TaxID=2012998 RepID=A0A532UNQ7_UNCL8|nr:MAG: Fis family transcriptional regulator [candidate division LCP-89 bacterium B3_LCP]
MKTNPDPADKKGNNRRSTGTPQDNRFFKVILSSIADGVFTVDKDRVVTSFNPAAERITGVPASVAVSKKCYEVFHSNICEDNCLLERTLNTGEEAIDIPVQILNNSGRRIPISISTAVLRDEDGQVLGAVETFRDLSAIEVLRKDLERSYSFEDIISKSPTMMKLFAILPDVAESESTVLIQGASGSGKELFARAVHNLSPRKDKSYIIINCGTLPTTLFESELFGYLKGAFTDAKKDKPGKISLAEGGTVFLDEVGDLPLQTQVKLLRLLQHHEYEPVGGLKSIKADIRIVAATNRDLKGMVTKGSFREDLYFRLAVIRFEIPPLKERREDIPYLIDHFMRRFNARKGKNLIGVSPKAMEALMRHNYPGNVRELENAIEYGYAVCRGRIIEFDHLPEEIQSALSQSTSDPESLSELHPAHRHISEEIAIREALKRRKGNRTLASGDLGMDRTTLWRKMRRYGIQIPKNS